MRKEKTNVHLWLPSETQVFGETIFAANELNDSKLDWFSVPKNRVKFVGGSASYWWLRSPRSGYSYAFCIVLSNGSANYDNAGNSNGVSPGFTI